MNVRAIVLGSGFPIVLAMSLSLTSCASQPTVSQACGQEKDFHTKVSACSDDVQKNPANDLAHYWLAVAYAHYYRYEDALQHINSAITLNSKEGWYFEMRCRVKDHLAQYSDALRDCSTAIDLIDKAQNFENYKYRATIYYHMAMYAKAEADVDSAMKLKPDDLETYSWQCKLLFLMSDNQDALPACKRYLTAPSDLNPEAYKWTMAYTGAIYYQLKEFDQSRPYAQWIVQNEPLKTLHFSGDNLLDLFNLNARRQRIQSLKDEAALQESTHDLNQAFATYYEAYGYEMGYTPADEKDAIAISAKLFELYPKLVMKPTLPEIANQYLVEGGTYFKNNDSADAIRSYLIAYSIAPWFPPSSYNLALLYAQTKDYQRAIQYMNGYVKLAPESSDAKDAQNQIYEWTADMGLPH